MWVKPLTKPQIAELISSNVSSFLLRLLALPNFQTFVYKGSFMIDAISLLKGKNGISSALAERLLAGNVAVFAPLKPIELMQIADMEVDRFYLENNNSIIFPSNMSEILIESLAKDCSARNICTALEKLVLRCESQVYDSCDKPVQKIIIHREIVPVTEHTLLISSLPEKWNSHNENCLLRTAKPSNIVEVLPSKITSLILDLESTSSEQWNELLTKLDKPELAIVGFVSENTFDDYHKLLQRGVKIIVIDNTEPMILLSILQCAQHRAIVLSELEENKRRFVKASFKLEVQIHNEDATVLLCGPDKQTAFDPNDFDVPFMRLHTPQLTFADVVGNDSLKAQMRLIRNQINVKGAKPDDLPKGMLFSGPPGTGKTYMAEAFAGELKLPFITINSADIVAQGNAVDNLKRLFEVISKISPCVVFFDEMDSLGRARNEHNAQHSLAVNTLLAQMDGISTANGISFFIAATNHPNLLDPALLRAGRYEREIRFQFPSEKDRLISITKNAIAYSIGLDSEESEALASLTQGQTHKAIQNFFRDTALYSVSRSSNFANLLVTILNSTTSFNEETMENTEELMRIKSVHEAGHFLCARIKKPDVKVNLLSAKYGVTICNMMDEMNLPTKQRLHSVLVFLLGGRAAESEMIGDDMITVGSFDDMRRATAIAREVIIKLGSFDQCDGVDASQLRSFEALIDKEVGTVVNNAYEEAKKLVREHRTTLEHVAELLINKDYLLEGSLEKIIVHRNMYTANVVNLH
jgi:cell division protease FtsH